MAKTRDIRRRIKSVANTMKITRTMEMVATVKAKQCQDRLKGALPYSQGINAIVGRVIAELGQGRHPLFRRSEKPAKTIVLAVSSNRGFCGGFNSNVIHAARAEVERIRSSGGQAELQVSGKKAVAFFRFLGWDTAKAYTEFDDKVSYGALERIASDYIGRFTAGSVDEVKVVSYRFLSASRQEARTTTLLPFAPVGREVGSGTAAFCAFDPEPEAILREIVPFAVKINLFALFLESVTSEHMARRLAMKLATDNATEMLRDLKSRYNRARQDQITMELSDIMGGAAAIEA